jgi:hypothetical protein
VTESSFSQGRFRELDLGPVDYDEIPEIEVIENDGDPLSLIWELENGQPRPRDGRGVRRARPPGRPSCRSDTARAAALAELGAQAATLGPAAVAGSPVRGPPPQTTLLVKVNLSI